VAQGSDGLSLYDVLIRAALPRSSQLVEGVASAGSRIHLQERSVPECRITFFQIGINSYYESQEQSDYAAF